MPILQLRPRHRHPIALAVVALALASLTGCVPTVWLPDSSGFIYVKPTKVAGQPGGQLMHYDLQKKTSRVIVEDVGAATTWPALSPDGKRIAVARLAGGPKEARTVQIALHDLQGKQLHLSRAFAWGPAKANAPPDKFLLFWSPKNNMVVVSDGAPGGLTGFYNVKTDSLKLIEKSMAVIHGGTPIRPDGKGVLLLVGEKADQRLVFMDWQGKGEKIDADAFLAAMPKDPKDKGPGIGLGQTVLGALMLPSGWDGDAAWVSLNKRDKATYAIDTGKKKIDVSDAFATMTKKHLKNPPLHFDFAGDVTVRVVKFTEKQPNGTNLLTFNKISVVNNKTRKEETLLAKGADMALFLPSPDGKNLALCLTSMMGPMAGGLADQILVITNKGDLVANLPFGGAPAAKPVKLSPEEVAANKKKSIAARAKLKGVWTIASSSSFLGQNPPFKKSGSSTMNDKLTFADDTVTHESQGKKASAAYTIDAGPNPAEMDVTPSEGPNKGVTMKMIFLLDGDNLKLAMVGTGAERPKGFNTKGPLGTTFLKRMKK